LPFAGNHSQAKQAEWPTDPQDPEFLVSSSSLFNFKKR